MAVETVVKVAANEWITSKGAWGMAEAANVLVQYGGYATYEAAVTAIKAAPEVWYERAATLSEAWSGNKLATFGTRVITGGKANVVTSATETALQVAKNNTLTASTEYVKTGGINIVKRTVEETPKFGVAGLMAMDVGLVGAAVAPILGVALGEGLYNENPELWTKISQRLLPFCYPDTTEIPTWAEAAEAAGEIALSVLVGKEVVDAIKSLFEEEGIPLQGDEPETIVNSDAFNQPVIAGDGTVVLYGTPTGTHHHIEGGEISAVWRDPSYSVGATWTIASSQPFTYKTYDTWSGPSGTHHNEYTGSSTAYTYNGRTVYYDEWSGGYTNSEPPINIDLTVSTGNVAWHLVYGDKIEQAYPQGTSKWEGTIPSSIPTGDPIVVDEDGNVIDTVPISPPIEIPSSWAPGLPAPSNNAEDYPDPDVIYDPDSQIDPFLLPMPQPQELIDPTIAPSPSPEEDPTQPPDGPTDTIVDVIPPIDPPSGISDFSPLPSTDTPFDDTDALIAVYHPSTAQFKAFARWLWVTLQQASINTVWNNPFDGVITAFELYCTPTDIGARNIKSGFLDSGINSPIISRYTEINCGTIGVPEYYGNYLDYSPYSKAQIYLPFIGIQDLNVDDIVGHGVNVTYRIDEYNGSCIAMITVAKSTNVNGVDVDYSNTMYQFSGNCAVELPLSGGNQSSILAGQMTANAYQQASRVAAGASIIGGVGSALSGNIVGGISGIVSGAATAAFGQATALSHMLSGKSDVQKSGQFGASYGALGIKRPFIVVTRPKQVQVINYNKLYGFPAHKAVIIGSCTGFLRCREVHVISATANDEEKSRIEELLKSGVYVTE